MSISETLISYETAVLAKEKGFDYWTEDFFFNGKEEGHWDEGCPVSFDGEDYYIIPHDKSKDIVNRPRQALLQKWLREERGFIVEITWYMCSTGYEYAVIPMESDPEHNDEIYRITGYNTYEEALEAGLQKALE